MFACLYSIASPLTARELKLIEVFASHPGEVLTRDV
jgi:DNA-binding response OmpR family regulator